MADHNNANVGFEKQIWNAACVLWGHIPAAEYRKVIVGLIFLRYISCAFEKRYQQLVDEGEGFEDDRDAYAENNVFFVPQEARWATIAAAAHTPEIGKVIDAAMKAIEAENPVLKNVLPKNYGNPDLDKTVLGQVVDLFTNEIHMDDTDESKDLLGRTYEYCIAQFAAYEGTDGGEFYTPSSIVKTLVEILKPFENCRVYDPCCGSGGMFVQSNKFIQAHSGKRGAISVYGQEANADTWKMAKINMAIRGIDADFGQYQADTFSNDLHPQLKADFILANPPFNYHSWGQENLKEDKRWKYGLPPASNANFAWIQHMIHHLAPNGKIGLVLANGALSSQSGGEGTIRENIVKADLVEGIVALPTQLFYSVTINSNASIKERPLIYPSELSQLNRPGDMGHAIVTVFGYQPIRSEFTPSYAATAYTLEKTEQRLGAGRYFDEEKIFYDMKKRNETVAPRRRPTGGKRATEINMQRQISAATEMLKGEVERLITNELLTETKQIELLQAIDRHCFRQAQTIVEEAVRHATVQNLDHIVSDLETLSKKLFEVSMIIGDEQLKN